MPNPGDILNYKDYEFEDGTKSNKLFVVLNAPAGNSPYLVLKTTSQSKRYTGVTQGCNPNKKTFFVPTSWEPCFDLDTYIQIPQIIEIPSNELIQGGLDKKIILLQNSLSNNCLAQLRNCLKKFKYDISGSHWAMIFKAK
jgi:hypothetical protein